MKPPSPKNDPSKFAFCHALPCLAAVVLAFCSAAPAQGADWTYSGTGNWFTPQNWSGTMVPTTSTEVVVNTGTTVLINQAGAASRNVVLGNQAFNTAGVEVTGPESTWALSGSLSIGQFFGGTARLDITNGGVVTVGLGNNVIMGSGQNSQGVMRVSGSGSQLQMTGSNGGLAGNVAIGQNGIGKLQIENGGAVTLAGNVVIGTTGSMGGSLIVSGTGSRLEAGGNLHLNAGFVAPSSVLIEDGATVRIGQSLNIGVFPVYRTELNIGNYDRSKSGGALEVETIVFTGYADSGTSVINFNQTDNFSLDANISGRGSVVQRGIGTTLLTGSNTYTGSIRIPLGGMSSNIVVGTLVQSGTLLLQGSGASITHNDSNLVVDGIGGESGTFLVSDGASVSTRHLFISGSAGLGGSMTVENGAQASILDALWIERNGSLRVTGTGTRLIHSNTGGSRLSVSGGLSVENGAEMFVGIYDTRIGASGTGTLLVSGPGSTFRTGGLELGASSHGKLIVEQGGLLTTGSNGEPSYIGRTNTGEATITGAGSEWRASTNLRMGESAGTHSLTIADGGQVNISGVNSELRMGGAAGSVSTLNLGAFDGTTTAGSLSVSRVSMQSAGVSTINFNQTDNLIFGADIQGQGNVVQRGTGTTTLLDTSGSVPASNFSGTTLISRGTLKVEKTNGLGSSSVRVQDTGILRVGAGFTLSSGQSVALDGDEAVYAKDFSTSEALSRFGTIVSSSTNASVFQILGGVAGEALTIETSFLPDPSEMAFNDAFRISDVLSIEGTSDTVFVMQLSYTQAAYNVAAGAGLYTSETELRLGYLVNNQWANAGSGPFVIGAWNGTLAVGTYGVDTENNVVWAVVDHNSEYSVVPEPSTFVLMGLGLGGLALLRRRQK